MLNPDFAEPWSGNIVSFVIWTDLFVAVRRRHDRHVVSIVTGDARGIVDRPNLFLGIVNEDGLAPPSTHFLTHSVPPPPTCIGAAHRIAYPTVDRHWLGTLVSSQRENAGHGKDHKQTLHRFTSSAGNRTGQPTIECHSGHSNLASSHFTSRKHCSSLGDETIGRNRN